MSQPTPEQLRKQARQELAREGGVARNARMTPEQRTEHARKMLAARWEKYYATKGGRSKGPSAQ